MGSNSAPPSPQLGTWGALADVLTGDSPRRRKPAPATPRRGFCNRIETAPPEVVGQKGYVQRVTTRGTLLLTMDGNRVQIPNSTIYKETIVNYTANPFMRCQFNFGIGYDDPVAEAQSVALEVLKGHQAITHDPEPLVLVEALGSATVNLTSYFWVDTKRFSQFKVRSAMIRLTKKALLDAGVTLPDEAREVVFPNGVPIRMVEDGRPRDRLPSTADVEESSEPTHSAEGNLESEAETIKRQAQHTRLPDEGEDLLKPSSND